MLSRDEQMGWLCPLGSAGCTSVPTFPEPQHLLHGNHLPHAELSRWKKARTDAQGSTYVVPTLTFQSILLRT